MASSKRIAAAAKRSPFPQVALDDDSPLRFRSVNALVDHGRKPPSTKAKKKTLKSKSSRELELQISVPVCRKRIRATESFDELDDEGRIQDEDEQEVEHVSKPKGKTRAPVLGDHLRNSRGSREHRITDIAAKTNSQVLDTRRIQEQCEEEAQDEERWEQGAEEEDDIEEEQYEKEDGIADLDRQIEPVDLSGFQHDEEPDITLDFEGLEELPTRSKIKHADFKDRGYPLVPAGQYSSPPPTSRYTGLLMAFNGVPVHSDAFEQHLKASVHRCLPDTSQKWLSEDFVEGKKALLRDILGSFGEGISKQYILQRARRLMESRRNNHRRRAAQGLQKPSTLSEQAWRTHLSHTGSTKHKVARQTQKTINKLGSGGWASVCNTFVKKYGFVPSSSLRKQAVEHGAARFFAALEKSNLPLKDPFKSVEQIWAEHYEKVKRLNNERKEKLLAY